MQTATFSPRPTAYTAYAGGVVIMDPFNVTADDINKVKRDLNVMILMYFDTTDMAINAADGVCAADNRNYILAAWAFRRRGRGTTRAMHSTGRAAVESTAGRFILVCRVQQTPRVQ